MELLVMGRVLGADKVQQNLAGSPTVYREEVMKWLLGENTAFIGSKTKPGLIRQRLYDKRRWSDSGTWRKQVVNLVNGKIVDPFTGQVVTRAGLFSGRSAAGTGLFKQGVSMTLKMGVLYRTQKQIHKAMEFLEEGGSISSNKYMPVPVHGAGLGKAYEKFKYWLKAGMFTIIYRNGLALYFLKNKSGQQSRDDLKFVGRKRVNVNFRMGLRSAFEGRKSAMVSRGQIAADKATARINNT